MNKTKISILALALLLAGVGAANTYAFGDKGDRPELTDEQKSAMEQIHELMQSGDVEGAKALAESVGLPARPERPEGHREGPVGDPEHREAVNTALENGDYGAFVELTADAPFAGNLTEEIFNKMVEAHQLMEEARGIMDEVNDELGIERPEGHPGMPLMR